MTDNPEVREDQDYTVFLIGGEKLSIRAHRLFVNEGANRIYFIRANNETVEDWVVFISGVAAIYSSTGKVQFGAKNM